jgi:hypothetical protein
MRQTEGTAWGSRNRMFTLRIVRMIMTVVAVALLLAGAIVQSFELWVIAVVFFAAWLVITVLEIYYMSRIRRRLKASQNV